VEFHVLVQFYLRATLSGMPPSCNFSDSERSFPIGREFAFVSSSVISHSPNEISFLEAPQSNLGVVASYHPKLACCHSDLALVKELVDQVKVDRQSFLIEGYIEHLSSDGRLTYLDRDHCFGFVRQVVRCLLCGCLEGASICPYDFY